MENEPKVSRTEECPRLILETFSRPPQVVFDNVPIGCSCERSLEVFNPSKQLEKITLGKSLPPGLVIHLPEEWLELEPENCCCLTMTWTPSQLTAIRETVQFTNEHGSRYDVLVVLKSVKALRQNWAASKIQALFRGNKCRALEQDPRVGELRRRWRAGALRSTQDSLQQRHDEAMKVLRNPTKFGTDFDMLIRTFQSLQLCTEVNPMKYHDTAAWVVPRVLHYMGVMNRSLPGMEVLSLAAEVLVNLARYKVTGPNIYARERIPPILKFMWRFSKGETTLLCILSTYLWLYSKYDEVREDLTEFLHHTENLKILKAIKGNVDRMKRMTSNSRTKLYTPQPRKSVSYSSFKNSSVCSAASHAGVVMPALEPDYGIQTINNPTYFTDAQQGINSLFHIYKLSF